MGDSRAPGAAPNPNWSQADYQRARQLDMSRRAATQPPMQMPAPRDAIDLGYHRCIQQQAQTIQILNTRLNNATAKLKTKVAEGVAKEEASEKEIEFWKVVSRIYVGVHFDTKVVIDELRKEIGELRGEPPKVREDSGAQLNLELPVLSPGQLDIYLEPAEPRVLPPTQPPAQLPAEPRVLPPAQLPVLPAPLPPLQLSGPLTMAPPGAPPPPGYTPLLSQLLAQPPRPRVSPPAPPPGFPPLRLAGQPPPQPPVSPRDVSAEDNDDIQVLETPEKKDWNRVMAEWSAQDFSNIPAEDAKYFLFNPQGPQQIPQPVQKHPANNRGMFLALYDRTSLPGRGQDAWNRLPDYERTMWRNRKVQVQKAQDYQREKGWTVIGKPLGGSKRKVVEKKANFNYAKVKMEPQDDYPEY